MASLHCLSQDSGTLLPRLRRLQGTILAAKLVSGYLSCSRIASGCLSRSIPLARANVQRDQGVDLRRLEHHVDIDLLVPGADAPTARTDLDGGYADLVIDIGVGPDAGAVRRLRPYLLAEKVAEDLLRRLQERLDVLALVAKQGPVDIEIVSDAQAVQHSLELGLDHDGADLRRDAYVDVDRADAGKIIRPVRRAAFDGADIDLRKQGAGGRFVD